MPAVYISDELYMELTKLAKQVGFNNVDEFIHYVLRELVLKKNDEILNEEEEKEIERRLRDLGYI